MFLPFRPVSVARKGVARTRRSGSTSPPPLLPSPSPLSPVFSFLVPVSWVQSSPGGRGLNARKAGDRAGGGEERAGARRMEA